MIVKKFPPSSPRAYRSLTRTYILPCEPLVARVAVWTRGCAYATIMLPDEAGEPTDTRLDERGAFLSSDATPAARGDLLMLITGKWIPAVDADGAQTVSILQGMQVCRQQQLQVRSIEGADLGPYKIQSKFHRVSRAST